jgi:hypothetical protein
MQHTLKKTHKFMAISKYSYITIHDYHGFMMYYATHVLLCFHNTKKCNEHEYITTIFYIKTPKKFISYAFIKIIHVQNLCSSTTFKAFIQSSSNNCPIIILGDFNINILNDNNGLKIMISRFYEHIQIKIPIP